MAFRIRAEVLMKFAGYKNDEIYKMDDISVFRRFFVVQNIINEIIQAFSGGRVDPSGVPSEYTNPNRYGEDPFLSDTASTSMNETPFGFSSTI